MEDANITPDMTEETPLQIIPVWGYTLPDYLLGNEEMAYEDPMNRGEFLIPPNTTKTAPLPIKAGYAQVWTGQYWKYVEDHRKEFAGEPYWLPGDTHQTEGRYMDRVGPYPTVALLKRPERTRKELIRDFDSFRQGKFNDVQWLIERAAEEAALAIPATLSNSQYQKILMYRQALRDMPTLNGYPWDGGRENTPWPIFNLGE